MEDFLTLNTLAWVVVAFFVCGWTYGVLTQSYYATKNNIMIVTWWWLCIAAIIFFKLSPFFLWGLMPIAAFLSLFVPCCVFLVFSRFCMGVLKTDIHIRFRIGFLFFLLGFLIFEDFFCFDNFI